MRIGILTLPLHTNYGGILQAYALQTVLERMGSEVCLIEKRRRPARVPLWKTPLTYGKRVLKNVMGTPYPIFIERKINREIPVVRQHTEQFVRRYVRRRMVGDFSELKEGDFDAIVVGSDQVWRPGYLGRKIEEAYLDFACGWDVRRVAYAASFGTDEWSYTAEQTKACGDLLRLFEAVSVREDSAVGLCRTHFGVEARQVLDPTMLLPAEDYVRLFKAAGTPKSPGTLFCYILDETPEKMAFIDKVAKEKGGTPFHVNSKVDVDEAPVEERIHPPVEQWLRGFHDAEFVVTDSFHGCVFSILFNKPFVAIGNSGRGLARFSSLLGRFGLKDRMLTDFSSYGEGGEIDWERVNSLLEGGRKDAGEFLHRALLL